MSRHVVQSKEWAKFKDEYGTPTVTVGDLVYTKHQIPFTDKFFAYCPKIDPLKIDFDMVKKSLEAENCININFDVPNVLKSTDEEVSALKIFKSTGCILAGRDQFAKANVLMDLTKTEDELLTTMHHKQRYNIKYAQRNGVTVELAKSQEDFDIFWEMFETTSVRQKYYVRPKKYYQKIWDMFKDFGFVYILTAKKDNDPLASWMLFYYEGVLYYPYGGSSEKHKNLFGSTLLGWEAILLGKKLGCHTFDMWGASHDPADEKDPWAGFTNFKLKFGGTFVTYMDSYDFVVNQPIYKMFGMANDLRWKFLNLIK